MAIGPNWGTEETPPTRRIAAPDGADRSLATGRNETSLDMAMTHSAVESAETETMKRPSCKWKGQTDADEDSMEGAGSPISLNATITKAVTTNTPAQFNSTSNQVRNLLTKHGG